MLFRSFRLSDGAQHWQMGALPSAYNACLSVTILPTVLAQALGLPGTVVFKVLLQLVFALVPVLTYLYGRRLVVEIWSPLREQRRFDSLEELVAAIDDDVERTRTVDRPG